MWVICESYNNVIYYYYIYIYTYIYIHALSVIKSVNQLNEVNYVLTRYLQS